jgi:hypothetical protein
MISAERCEPEPRQTRAAAATVTFALSSSTTAPVQKKKWEEKTNFYLFWWREVLVVARVEKTSATLKSCEDRAAHAAPLRSLSACALGLAPYLTVSRDRLDLLLLSGWWDWQAARSGGTVAAAVPPPPPIPLSARSLARPPGSSHQPLLSVDGWMDSSRLCTPG